MRGTSRITQLTLVGIARAHADVPGIARLNYIVQGMHLYTE